MQGEIIIIDGISNSGKTSFCEYLSKYGFFVIDEVPSFIEKNKNLGALSKNVPKTLAEEKSNQDVIYKAEIERLRIAENEAINGKNVIMDRSFLSTVAMAYALEKDLPFKGAYDYSKELEKNILTEIKRMSKKVNVYLIFFDVNRDVLLDRNKKRKKELSAEWIEEEFLEKQKLSFLSSAKSLNTVLLDTSYLSLDDIAKLICGKNYKKKI